MRLATRTFLQYVQDMAATAQSSTAKLLDLSTGSIIRSLLEAHASVALWLQVLIADTFDASRAATAQGRALDTWMADFSLTRMPATYALGYVTLTRHATTGSISLSPGLRVRATPSNVTFRVLEDASHSNWSNEDGKYVLLDGQPSLTVPVQSETAGLTGNAPSGTITKFVSSVAGFDDVDNNQPASGGVDAETDNALRARFVEYINSRSKATISAVSFAIHSVRQGLKFQIYENIDSAGSIRLGNFLIVVDDGTRRPTQNLLDEIAKEVDKVRPVGISFAIHQPYLEPCDITCTITVDTPDAHTSSNIRITATECLRSFVMNLGIGEGLPTTRVAQIVYAVDSRILNVSNVRLNGGTDDLIPGPRGAITPGLVSVS